MAEISWAQVRKIWARSREIGWEEEQLRDLVEQVCGDRSLRALSKVQAAQVIDRLERGSQPTRKRFPGVTSLPEGVLALPAAGHISRVRELQEELGWDEEHLNAWLLKYFQVQNMRGLDWRRARGGFLALRSIKHRKKNSKPGGK